MHAPPAPPGDRDGAGALVAWAVVALLCAVDAAPYFVSFIEADFARDLTRRWASSRHARSRSRDR
jgi:hypothetical protein